MSKNKNALLGAAFLMATSAVGPGFLTQTTVFTEKLATSFGFVILLVACRKQRLMDNYRHSIWLQMAGWAVVLILLAMGFNVF